MAVCVQYRGHIGVGNQLNTLRPRQNGRHFADDIFKCISVNENVCILIKISLKFVPKGPINNIQALVQVMAWRRSGDKPLSEPMMVSWLTHICVTRPQWVKCAPQAVTLQQAPSPCLHWHVKGRIARKPDWFSSVGCLSTQTFPCVAYLQRCWYVYMNIHFVICFQTFRYRFIYFLHVQSEYSAMFLCGHTLTDSLITTLSPTNSTNPIS